MANKNIFINSSQSVALNPEQVRAYNSQQHCVVLAGPGSGKTKTLTLKMSRILREDVREPRGVACITYNNECARELQRRLTALGVDVDQRVFIGTVHSFSLRHIILPYARYAPFKLPSRIRVATDEVKNSTIEQAYKKVYGDGGDPRRQWFFVEPHRRSVLDRSSAEWREGNTQRAEFIEVYEQELHKQGFIDFDDMPILGLHLLQNLPWLPAAIEAKFPVMLVDEYQDLGFALDAIVNLLCFEHSIRLFAVGDVDQSIYGFLGAEPALLRRLTEREDVETIQLAFNYRCGSRIIAASQAALGEERSYRNPKGSAEGEVFFHALKGDHADQAHWILEKLIPQIMERQSISFGEIAVLYREAWLGKHIAKAADRLNINYVRTDRDALYPRGCRLLRWIEDCALWACVGWREARPRFRQLLADGYRLAFEMPPDDAQRHAFERHLMRFLTTDQSHDQNLGDWLEAFHREILFKYSAHSNSINDELDLLRQFQEKVGADGPYADMTIADF